MKICPTCKYEYAGGEVFCPVDASRLVSMSQLSASPRDPDDPLIGAVLGGNYEVVRRIGEGGMGLVYEGVHRAIDKHVAIKVLRSDLSTRPDVVERFRQEAKSASRIGHEHIVDVFDFGETLHGANYFVMEHLDGEDLADVLSRDLVLETDRAVDIALQCARALGAAHSMHIVHRDIKPENIFLTTRDGKADFVKIVDFGIAKISDLETEGAPGRKLTKTGMIFGTPEYMSPEQAAGKELDHRVDVYALGVILYECLAGRVPFVGDTFMGILTQHIFEEPPSLKELNPNSDVDEALELVVRQALAKDPQTRFQTMAEFEEALTYAQRGEKGPQTERFEIDVLKSGERLVTPGVRSFSMWGWTIAAAVLLIAIGSFVWTRPKKAESSVSEPAATTVAEHQTTVANHEPVVEEPTFEPGVPRLAQIEVHTDPSGAMITRADGNPGCGPTPCVVEALVGEELKLTARSGRNQGETTLTPSSSGMVHIVLSKKASRRAGAVRRVEAAPAPVAAPVSEPPPARPKRQPKQRGDLKVPDFAR